MQTLCLATNLTSAEWAAWVQAGGSIAAIVASALIVRWQINRQHALQVSQARLLELRDELRLIEGFRDVAEYGKTRLEQVCTALETAKTWETFEKLGDRVNDFSLVAEALDAADASRMSTAELTLSLMAARKAYRAGIAELDDIHTWGGPRSDAHRFGIRDRVRNHAKVLGVRIGELTKRAEQIHVVLEA